MKTALLSATLATASASSWPINAQRGGSLESDCKTLFTDFKAKYHKKYSTSDEESKRLEIFCANMKEADKRNALNEGRVSFGASKFADLTFDEFKPLLGRKKGTPLGYQVGKVAVRDPKEGGKKYNLKLANDAAAYDMPAYVNWMGTMTTPVKNQGQCGSCWAFSVAETVESQWAMAGNALWEFSPQQIASCTGTQTSGATQGCGGGFTQAAYEYIQALPTGEGLGSSAFAPYIQSMTTECTDLACTESCSDIVLSTLESQSFYTGPYASISGYTYGTPECASGKCQNQNTTLLAQNVAVYGPASVCVDASQWNLYTGGVMSETACGGMAAYNLDHCVQLVGYNNQVTPAYWIVRNSWATNWGENGLIYLAYPGNTCGLANEATFPTISN